MRSILAIVFGTFLTSVAQSADGFVILEKTDAPRPGIVKRCQILSTRFSAEQRQSLFQAIERTSKEEIETFAQKNRFPMQLLAYDSANASGILLGAEVNSGTSKVRKEQDAEKLRTLINQICDLE